MERAVGTWRIAVIYLSSGLFGVLMSCLFIPDVIGVGASGTSFVSVIFSSALTTTTPTQPPFLSFRVVRAPGSLYGLIGAMFGDFFYSHEEMEPRAKW